MVRESSDSANRQTPSAGSEDARTGKRGDRKTAGGRSRALNLVEKGAKKRTRLRGGASKRQRRIDSVSAKCQREMSARERVMRSTRTTAAKARNRGAKRAAAHSVRAEESMALNQNDNRRVTERRDRTDSSAQRQCGRVDGAQPNRSHGQNVMTEEPVSHPIVTGRTEKRAQTLCTYHKQKQTSQLRLTQYPCRHE